MKVSESPMMKCHVYKIKKEFIFKRKIFEKHKWYIHKFLLKLIEFFWNHLIVQNYFLIWNILFLFSFSNYGKIEMPSFACTNQF